MQVSLGHGKGIVFILFCSNAQLSFPLPFGEIQLKGRQFLFQYTIDLLPDKTDAALPLLRISCKIDGKKTGVAVKGYIRLHMVHQSVFLSERGIETTVKAAASRMLFINSSAYRCG